LIIPAILALSGCGSDVTPEGLAPAPWFTIGKGPVGYTSLDTSRIQSDGQRRIVWVRTDFLAPDSAPKVPGAAVDARESRHVLECGIRRVTDLETILRDSVGKPVGDRPREASRAPSRRIPTAPGCSPRCATLSASRRGTGSRGDRSV
jgi:hypothetical protein